LSLFDLYIVDRT